MARSKNKQSFVAKPIQRLLLALLLSFFLHLIFFASLGPVTSKHKSRSDILQVRLAQSTPLAQERSIPLSSVLPTPSQTNEKITPLASTKTKSQAVSNTQSVKRSTTSPFNIASPTLDDASKILNQQPVSISSNSKGPPNWVEIEFDISEGENRIPLGKGIQHYISNASDHYQLSFKSPMREMDSSDFKPDWQVEIEGNITTQGLNPSTFKRQGSLAQSLMSLHGINGDAAATEDQQEGHMPDGILDRFSMLYQFMHAPLKNNEDKLWLTDGTKIAAYTYHVIGIEPIKVDSRGTLKAKHLVFIGDEIAETIDLWLAPDFHYLPVKVIYKDSQGKITEMATISFTIQ